MMYMKRITSKEYRTLIGPHNRIFYNSAEFIELNRDKTDEIFYTAALEDESPRFIFAFGVRDDTARSPFSAPFAIPVSLRKKPGLKHYDEAADSLEEFAHLNHWKQIRFTFPPMFYFREELSAWLNTFYRRGWMIMNTDINYALNLNEVYSDNYMKNIIMYNAKKNLKTAMKSNLQLLRCMNDDDTLRAYNVIAENRAGKGFPLRMSYEQVMNTVKLVGHEMFIVRRENDDIASALVYMVSGDTAQVIYWGDRLEFRKFRPINFLSYNLIQFYGSQGLSWLDIGPSTEDSVPNYGLCDFKESIGCRRELKYTVSKIFRQ